jgi:hypothetical protein
MRLGRWRRGRRRLHACLVSRHKAQYSATRSAPRGGLRVAWSRDGGLLASGLERWRHRLAAAHAGRGSGWPGSPDDPRKQVFALAQWQRSVGDWSARSPDRASGRRTERRPEPEFAGERSERIKSGGYASCAGPTSRAADPVAVRRRRPAPRLWLALLRESLFLLWAAAPRPLCAADAPRGATPPAVCHRCAAVWAIWAMLRCQAPAAACVRTVDHVRRDHAAGSPGRSAQRAW